MGNIAKWIEKIADGEDVIAAVIGRHDNERWDEEPKEYVGMLMDWPTARKILDYAYDNGYGGADCHPVFAWTETKIITVTEYDGATGPAWFPRHPISIVPFFYGAE